MVFYSHCGDRSSEAFLMNKEIRQSSSLRKKHLVVNDRMQKGYRYQLSAPTGRNFASDFKPELTPQQLLELGVFCNKYQEKKLLTIFWKLWGRSSRQLRLRRIATSQTVSL